jgi:hypothetical protein
MDKSRIFIAQICDLARLLLISTIERLFAKSVIDCSFDDENKLDRLRTLAPTEISKHVRLHKHVKFWTVYSMLLANSDLKTVPCINN